MKKLVMFSFFLLLAFAGKAQQDPLYSSYMQNPILINPAYSGTYNMLSVTALSRWQWLNMTGAPITNSLSAHSSVFKNKLGVGVILVNDRFGINNNTEGYGTFAYKINFGEKEDNVLSFGMQAGMMNYNFTYDKEKIKVKDEEDPNFPIGSKINATEPNFGAGVFYRNEKLYAGFSAPKILNSKFAESNSGLSQYRRHFFFTGGYLIDLITFQVKPSFLIKYVDGAPISIDVNSSVLIKDFIWLGASLRNFNTIVLMTQLQLTDNFRLGYALDIPINKVIRTSYGSHELMLNMDLKLLKSHDIGFRYF
ncbi:MAG: type IX secretion system membrane protein PorP/SprF [Opitutaceae bacterium]|nr:type IX secretion system membrane protein PorP/SprF [Cytophagales bacterium]